MEVPSGWENEVRPSWTMRPVAARPADAEAARHGLQSTCLIAACLILEETLALALALKKIMTQELLQTSAAAGWDSGRELRCTKAAI